MDVSTSEALTEVVKSLRSDLRKSDTCLSAVLEWIQQRFGKVPDDLELKLKCIEVDGRGSNSEIKMERGQECNNEVSHNIDNLEDFWDRDYHLDTPSPSCQPESEDFPNVDTPLHTPKPSSSNILVQTGQVKIVDIRTITSPASSTSKENNVHKCSLCTSSFPSIAELSIHSLIHIDVRLRPMGISQENMDLMLRFPRLFKIRRVNDTFHICKKITKTSSKKPSTLVKPVVKSKWSCPHCTSQFHSKLGFTRHLRTAHQILATSGRAVLNKCDICCKTFESSLQFNLHVQSVHGPMLNREKACNLGFQCETCGKWFKLRERLRYHVWRVHPDPTAATKCDTCGKTFKTYFHMRYHVKNTHPDPSLARTCETCGISCTTPKFLRNHIARVHVEKTFLCQDCGLAVKTQRALTNHRERVHTKAHVRHHKCTYCPSAFKNSASLQRHVNRHLGKDLRACPYCGIMKSNTDLYNHITIVHKGRKFKCNYCASLFSLRAHLKNHFALRHAELPIPPDSELEVVYTGSVEESAISGTETQNVRIPRRKPRPTPKSKRLDPINGKTSELGCLTCDAVFISKNDLELHMIRHAKNPDYRLKHRMPVQRVPGDEIVTEGALSVTDNFMV